MPMLPSTVNCLECEAEIEVYLYPGEPAQTYGPPEICHEGSDAELDAPKACPGCGLEITKEQRWAWILYLTEDGTPGYGPDEDDE